MTRNGLILGLATVLALTACNKKDPILPGERQGLREVLQTDAAQAEVNVTPDNSVELVALPAATANAEWRQAIGTSATRTVHPALGANPQLAWAVNIGAGDAHRVRITADPVVAGGRVFTLDAQAQISAVSTAGALLWSTDITPPNDASSNASGGGLAYGADKLFVSSGFGLLSALDSATGAVIWQQKLGASGTGTPAVLGDLVYVVAGDDVAWALETDTGRIRWQLSGSPDIHNVLGGPAPAITDKYAIFAFGAGEVQGAFRKGGLRLWDAQIAGERLGVASARVDDITGDPVVVGERVYTGSHSGRTVALDLGNGERIWTATEGPLNRVWPAGDSIFMVTDRNEIVRLATEDGRRIWGHELPLFKNKRPRRQSDIIGHFGPIIAGGQLIVASGDGVLRFFDPASGLPRGTVDLPGGATTNPVVAGNTLYVVSKKGQLLAFR
ncbi:Outer membrane protein assembly factor BamB, contains PQQ-like beta-propeller repeat [Roseovarius lutimaris]|uniref:Outer membrane protein assembly factor BamB, contains PQQ-like beta-propeller repeat n=1 Tax=Roseovarius lutimaris TaxID=1005928 RepID=A0A1I4YAD6_9RHOB|nr:PQQ-like beta-propeller repeat protein [Roseovarius lutimaris]SFN34529.1 Outer membrane protein assembly factor BamB, contains PQQ-like beta-propeller repeat [Roseovarius lutimaris]